MAANWVNNETMLKSNGRSDFVHLLVLAGFWAYRYHQALRPANTLEII